MNELDNIGLFEEDLNEYQFLIENFQGLTNIDYDMAFELAIKMIAVADRWNEIAFNANQYAQKCSYSKTDIYNWAYHRYRILMTMHDYCRVVYRQCKEDLRQRWSES